MFAFAAAVFFLIITPGPGVLSTAGVGAAYGVRAGSFYVGGLWLGQNFVALMVITGLAAVLLANPKVEIAAYFVALFYLGYIAFRVATAGAKLAFIAARKPPGILGGMALQVVNPKAYAVNTALFTGFGFRPENPVAEILAKLVVLNLIWVVIHFAWLWAGVVLHELNLPERVHRRINAAMALSMIAVVALLALSPR